MTDENVVERLLSKLTEKETLDLMEIDLVLADVLASLDDSEIEWPEEVDRFIVVQHIRIAYVMGYSLGAEEALERASSRT